MNGLSADRASEILEGIRDRRVLVVGDLMLDRYIVGSVERISPEAPVPVVRVESESSAVGGAANVAANVVSLGARCQMVGCVGDDIYGELLRREVEELEIGTEGVATSPTRPTTVKTRILARRQQVVRFDHETDQDVSGEVCGGLVAAIERLSADSDVLVVEDYNKGVLIPEVIEAVFAAARRHRIPTVVDPKRMRFFDYAQASVFKPNAKELEEALGVPLRPDDSEWMEEIRCRLECENLLLTLGERGMALRTSTGHHVRVPTAARAVYDVSGAGDTVTAAVAAALAAGAAPEEAAVLANLAAAIEVSKAGVATVTPLEICDELRAHQSH